MLCAGLDTCLSIMRVLSSQTGDPKYRPCPLLVRLISRHSPACECYLLQFLRCIAQVTTCTFKQAISSGVKLIVTVCD